MINEKYFWGARIKELKVFTKNKKEWMRCFNES
jgi:hypothetical protein